jgi:NitT/TauT family transport system substrate-binding protein
MTKGRILFSLLATALLAALVYIWAFKSASNDGDVGQPIRVGYVPVSTALPLFVAEKEGLFKKRGLTLKLEKFETANLAVDALASGRIDATSVVADLPWLTLQQRQPGIFRHYGWSILTSDVPMDMILVKKNSNITSLAGLEGKTIGTFPGSQLKAFAGAILQFKQVPSANVRITELPPASLVGALAAGSVDAIFCLQPVCTIAQKKIGAVAIETSPISNVMGDGRPISAASFGIATAFSRNSPSRAVAFVEAMNEAMTLINADPIKYRSLYPQFSPVPPDLAAVVPVTRFMTLQNYQPEAIEREIRVLTEAGLLKAGFDHKALVYKPN